MTESKENAPIAGVRWTNREEEPNIGVNKHCLHKWDFTSDEVMEEWDGQIHLYRREWQCIFCKMYRRHVFEWRVDRFVKVQKYYLDSNGKKR